ncbi:GNAT family N-acetyltransferase [Chitinimonas lacunae]|uniref:GNAT family N-acetyltransferase n=1 Tax=Chitinimonas lacunae TaxID=1963018 RepID=A0ABV8MUD3_9NEIS
MTSPEPYRRQFDDGCEIDTDPARLDIERAYSYIAGESYWARGIPRALFEQALANSLCFGVYRAGEMVGFARVVSDFATMAYLADVFVIESQRGQGLSKRLMEAISAHPALQGLRRWLLATADAHGLYAQYGFTALSRPERMMERFNPDIYRPS